MRGSELGSLGLTCTNCWITSSNIEKWITSKVLLYIAQGTLLNVLWQPGWEGSLGENGYMYMCD